METKRGDANGGREIKNINGILWGPPCGNLIIGTWVKMKLVVGMRV
jgi:cytochrome c-type biogenesis protein CcmH/NrfF